MQELSRGTAFDLNGWCAEHLHLMLGSTPAMTAFEEYIQFLRMSKLTALSYDIMVIAKPTPLIKGTKGKLRPIAGGNQFRKITMSALCKGQADKFRTHLGKEQYAVGVLAAIEKMAHTMVAHMAVDNTRMLIQIDAVSAFNFAKREVMLEEMARAYPAGIGLFAEWASRTSRLAYPTIQGKMEIFKTNVGIDQGCPGSPVLFAMGMKTALGKARERMGAEIHRLEGTTNEPRVNRRRWDQPDPSNKVLLCHI